MGAAATVSLAGATLGSGEGLIKSISLVCFFQSCKAALRVFDDMYTYNIYIYIYIPKVNARKDAKSNNGAMFKLN